MPRWQVQGERAWDRAGTNGVRARSTRKPEPALHAVRHHHDRAGHRLRQHRQPSCWPAGQAARWRWGCDSPFGASRRRLLAQLLTESSAARLHVGGIASLIIAQWTSRSSLRCCHRRPYPHLRFELQPPVILFTARASSLVTGDPCLALFPALHSTRADLVTSIRANAGLDPGPSRCCRRFRASLVTVQIALATGLLIFGGTLPQESGERDPRGSGCEGGSGGHLLRHFPERSGYDSTRSASVVRPSGAGAEESAGRHRSDRVPGTLLLAGDNWGTDVDVQGSLRAPTWTTNSALQRGRCGLLRNLGIKLIKGREFTDADRKGSGDVAIVNQTFAKKFSWAMTRLASSCPRMAPTAMTHPDRGPDRGRQVQRGERHHSAGLLHPMAPGQSSRIHQLLCEDLRRRPRLILRSIPTSEERWIRGYRSRV